MIVSIEYNSIVDPTVDLMIFAQWLTKQFISSMQAYSLIFLPTFTDSRNCHYWQIIIIVLLLMRNYLRCELKNARDSFRSIFFSSTKNQSKSARDDPMIHCIGYAVWCMPTDSNSFSNVIHCVQNVLIHLIVNKHQIFPFLQNLFTWAVFFVFFSASRYSCSQYAMNHYIKFVHVSVVCVCHTVAR